VKNAIAVLGLLFGLARPVGAVSTLTDVSPDGLEGLPFAVKVGAEERPQDGTVAYHFALVLPPEVSADRLSCFLRVERDQVLLSWSEVARRRGEEGPTYGVMVSKSALSESSLEIRVECAGMPCFDGYRFPLGQFAGGAEGGGGR
jgi:hypothetical protein